MLYFLLEEPSMKAFLEVVLPAILPENVYYRLIPHQGKSDLIASIPKKLKAIREPESKFIILHDQDARDCVDLKRELLQLTSFRSEDVLISIVCCELESWYLGDFASLQLAYPHLNLDQYKNKSKFREPDKLKNAKQELKTIVSQTYQPVSHSARIATEMVSRQNFENNRSISFQYFMNRLSLIQLNKIPRLPMTEDFAGSADI
jgi:hypothetical protein